VELAPVIIPANVAAIDAAWLSAALGVEITSVSPGGPIGGIAVTSRVVRLRLESPSPSAPVEVAVKIANPQWVHGSALHRREVRFYREFGGRPEIPAPRCYHAALDEATGAFALVLEDLTGRTGGHRLDGMADGEAEAVIDGIAAMHGSFWGCAELASLEVRGHDRERIAATCATFERRWPVLESGGKYPIDGALRAAIGPALERYPDSMARISNSPQTLIHADLHVENVLLEETPGGLRLWVIDWQNPCRGNAAFDLAYVVASLRPELIAAGFDPLIARWLDRVSPPGVSHAQLAADVAAAVRHMFISSASWFATFEAESLRDARTLQAHWSRIVAALIAVEAAA
jgi:aminoglycoside phosphotransferase (APT) family kinase protein